jgi:hypothetical protein
MREAAGQALQPGQPPGLGDQDRVEVNADQLDIRAQGLDAAIARTTKPSPQPTSTMRTWPAPAARTASTTGRNSAATRRPS